MSLNWHPIFPDKILLGKKWHKSENSISLLSFNVLQFNTDYQKFIALVRQVQPDIFLTVESNKDWEDAMCELDVDYPFQQKIALENTYGMHFYSKLKVKSCEVNYFMADDIPSINAILTISEGKSFRLFGIHPPPPSPTEESTSKERDGELVMIGKKAVESSLPVLVVGDFNNVAWSRSTQLFRKLSGLEDPRRGRGIFASYHAKYRFFRFPIDLLYHSPQINMDEFKVLGPIGSDHLPLYCRFSIMEFNKGMHSSSSQLDEEERKEAKEMIAEGKKENGNRKAD